MSKIISDFYKLCEIFDDDMDVVAEVIHRHYHIACKLSAVKADLEEYGEERLEKYHSTIKHILSLDKSKTELLKAIHSTKGLFD